MTRILSWALVGLLLWCGSGMARAAEPMVVHDVYFSLKEDTDDAKEKLVAACKKYLSGHPGVVWFAAGVRIDEHKRDVNDLVFDVALHMVFKDKASHDRYQSADRHHKFIEECSGDWESVRVFDSRVGASSHGPEQKKDRADGAKRPRLPDPAAFFSGMVRGKVVAKYDDGGFALAVEDVTKLWKNNKAKDPRSLVGKTVLVNTRKEEGQRVARFIRSLKQGETITIDVAHHGKGEALTILELTEEQRKRVD